MTTRRWVASVLFSTWAFGAPGSQALPPRIAALVPAGTTLTSQSFTGASTIAVAQFTAEKTVAEGRVVEYKLEVRAFNAASPAWTMQAAGHRHEMAARIATHRRGLAPESMHDGVLTADPVKESKHPWGSGLTQRVLHHPPRAKPYVTYSCAYHGMTGGTIFKLFVSGLPDSPDAADQWAEGVARTAGTLTVSNIADK